MTEDLNVTTGRVQQPQQQLDGRGFTGTVWAEQAKDLALADFKIHVVHGARLRAIPKILEHLG